MKVCVYGAGAIGGHVAARLISAGDAQVSIIARGAQLQAIREKGVTLISGGARFGGMAAQATDDPSELPPQDLVLVALKAHATAASAGPIARLLAPDGAVAFINNGIPWWWNHGLKLGAALPLLDPAGALWSDLGPQRTLGVVVYSSNSVREPGVIVHAGGDRWVVGEPDGADTARAKALMGLLAGAGLNAVASADIRRDIWRKLCVNVSNSPIAALTRLQPGAFQNTRGLSTLAKAMIEETLCVAAALGWDLHDEIDPQSLSRPSGGKPSMLQDVEAGRPIEVEAILGQVQAFAMDCKVLTPAIDVVLPLLRGLDASLRAAKR
jgi:2-dehydropantoate 2-reductase